MQHHTVQGAKYPKFDVKFGLREVRAHHAEEDPPDTFSLPIVRGHVGHRKGPVNAELTAKLIDVIGCEFRTIIRMPCHDQVRGQEVFVLL